MKSKNITTGSKLIHGARIALVCGTLLGLALAPAVFGQSNNQSNPVPQNQTATPNSQPAQPGPNQTPNATPNAAPNAKPDNDQTQPAQPQDQSQPATATPAPDSQQQTDKKDTDTKTDDQTLPKTASDLPLAGLIAMLAFGSAALVHTGRRIAA